MFKTTAISGSAKAILLLAPVAALALATPAIAHAHGNSPMEPIGAGSQLPDSKASQSNSLKVGLLATINAKEQSSAKVQELLTGAVELANEEAGTTVWYSFKTGPNTFGIFDAFGSDVARQAHLKGKIAEALTTSPGAELLASPLKIQKADILAAKRASGEAGLKVGLLATINAKEQSSAKVQELLTGAVELANEEAGTTVWYSFKTGPNTFGIFDAFGSDVARQAHLKGKIAEALTTSPGAELLASPLKIQKADILAAKQDLEAPQGGVRAGAEGVNSNNNTLAAVGAGLGVASAAGFGIVLRRRLSRR